MILGKENQSLIGHVTDCLFAMNARIDLDEAVLRTVCAERLKVDWEELLACLRYMAVMHDIGKATSAWQEEQQVRVKTGSNNPLITHALPSAYITASILRLSAQDGVNTPKHAATLAILGHHGQLNNQSANNDKLRPMRLVAEGWEQLSELAIQASGFNLAPYSYADVPLRKMGTAVADWKTELPRRQLGVRFKAMYCLMSSLLRNCDTEASIFAHEKASIEQPGNAFFTRADQMNMLHNWRGVMRADVLQGRRPNRLQQRFGELNNLCDLLNAGCGEGKTAFALQHAQHLMEQGKINRVIFTLPTKFTSNNMYKDFLNMYSLHDDMVGIFHGDSRLFLKELAKEKQQPEDEEAETENALIADWQQQDKVYHRPVTISTVDHLLMSFYHGYKYADWAFGNILQSLVVFDELHHYETLTASAINEALKILRLLRIPHLIMTATIPKSRIEVFQQKSREDIENTYKPLVSDGCEETTIERQEVRIKKAFRFRKCAERMVWAERVEDETIYTVVPSLLKEIVGHQTLRQIVFVNQVEKAKAVAKAIRNIKGLKPECEVICYHAEFIGRDRLDKEAQIRSAFKKAGTKPCVLIATQIAELSLDISADRMYTEIAPFDDIAQRGGRLNRNGVTAFNADGLCYEMVVYALNFEDKYDVLPYVKLDKHKEEAPENKHLLERSWDIIQEGAEYSFETVRQWVDALYDQPVALTHMGFQNAVTDDIVFGSKPQDRYSENGEEDSGQVVLRAREYETFDVVPSCYEVLLTNGADANRRFMLKINENKFWKAKRDGLIDCAIISMPKYNRRAGKMEYEDRRYYILKRPYSLEYGVDFSGELEFPDEQPISDYRNML